MPPDQISEGKRTLRGNFLPRLWLSYIACAFASFALQCFIKKNAPTNFRSHNWVKKRWRLQKTLFGCVYLEKLSPFWAPKAPFFSPFLVFLSEKITHKYSFNSGTWARTGWRFDVSIWKKKNSVVLEFLVRFWAPKAPFFRCKNDVEKQWQTSVYKIELREDEVCGERVLDVCI